MARLVRFITNGCILLSRTAPVKQKKHSPASHVHYAVWSAVRCTPKSAATRGFATICHIRLPVGIFLSHYVAGLARIISPRTKSIMLKANNSSSVHLTQFFWQAPGALTYAEKKHALWSANAADPRKRRWLGGNAKEPTRKCTPLH